MNAVQAQCLDGQTREPRLIRREYSKSQPGKEAAMVSQHKKLKAHWPSKMDSALIQTYLPS